MSASTDPSAPIESARVAERERARASGSERRAPGAPHGVLLVNLGTPDSASVGDVRRFLREFLSDPRVVELHPLLWKPLLNGVILPLRAPRSARLYASVWTPEGSPLLMHSRRQSSALAAELGDGWHVALGMRYGTPSLASALDELARAGCDRVVVCAAFPQYSNATTGTAWAAVSALAANRRAQPALASVPPFAADAGYVDALAARVRERIGAARVDHHVFSFHGLPAECARCGDPYPEQCRATATALARTLDLADGRWSLAYQSRFGRARWLEPDTETLVLGLARAGARRVAIAMPGFVCDCLETLEEIGLRLAESFHAAGGEELLVVPALNDHPAWIAALADLVRRTAPRV
jgi:ferrochelatase